MDTQFKIRLTGAIILVVLTVLIVPELLTGPKAPTAPPSQPTDSAPIRSYTIDLTGASPPTATRVVPSTAPLAPPSENAAPAVQAMAAPMSVVPSTAAPRATEGAPIDAALPQSTAQVAARVPISTTGFAVQLGSFANHDTAKRLAKQLQTGGFKVSIAAVTAGGRELLRVRVGPVADRAAAELLLKRLAAAGHKGPIVPFP